MLTSEVLFLIATLCALAALAVSVTTPKKSFTKSKRLPSFTLGHDVEDAVIIHDKTALRK